MKKLIATIALGASMQVQAAMPDLFHPENLVTLDGRYTTCEAAHAMGTYLISSEFWMEETIWSEDIKFQVYPMVSEEAKEDALFAVKVYRNIIGPAYKQGGWKAKIYYSRYANRIQDGFKQHCQGR